MVFFGRIVDIRTLLAPARSAVLLPGVYAVSRKRSGFQTVQTENIQLPCWSS